MSTAKVLSVPILKRTVTYTLSSMSSTSTPSTNACTQTNCGDKREFLFVPYSVFEVAAVAHMAVPTFDLFECDI